MSARIIPFLVLVLALAAAVMLLNQQRPNGPGVEASTRAERIAAWLAEQLPASYREQTGHEIAWSMLRPVLEADGSVPMSPTTFIADDVVLRDGAQVVLRAASLRLIFREPPVEGRRAVVMRIDVNDVDIGAPADVIPVRAVTALCRTIRRRPGSWFDARILNVRGSWHDDFTLEIQRRDEPGSASYTLSFNLGATDRLAGVLRPIDDVIALEEVRWTVHGRSRWIDALPWDWRSASTTMTYTANGLVEPISAGGRPALRVKCREASMVDDDGDVQRTGAGEVVLDGA